MRLFLLTLLFTFSTIAVNAQKLAVYFPYYRSVQQVDAIQYDKVTDVIYAFAKPTASGSSELLAPEIFDALRLKCSQNSVPFHLGMGGYGLSDNFRVIAADANLRSTFAQHCAALCTQYNLAGIDIDWEFPSPSEVDNVNLLLEAIKNELESISTPQNHIELSVAVGGEQGHTNYFKAGFSDYVDYVSIMAYDAPIGTWGHHSSMAFMINAIDVWKAMGVPVSKMLVGVPFYGRCAGEASYADISASNPATAFVSDNFNGYCYNGKPTLSAKTDTVMTKGCAGMMVWEVSHDRSDQYSLLSVIDETLSKYECPVPALIMDSIYRYCDSFSATLISNASEATGRVFSWYANGNLLYSGPENEYTTSETGQFELKVEESECTKTVLFEVVRSMDLSDVPSTIILCNPGIDTVFSPYLIENGFKTIWEFNNETTSINTDFQEVLQPGAYKLTVFSTYCPSIEKYIQVSNAGPQVTARTVCEGNIELLYSESENLELVWYFDKNDQQSFFEGDTLTYVAVESDTLYYEEKSTFESLVFSEIESGFNQNATFYGTKFSITNTAHLSSFDVVTIANGLAEFTILNQNLDTVHSTSTNVVNGLNTILVDWNLTTGTYYLVCTESPAGQLKLFSTYSASDIVVGNVTLHSGVYNSFAVPAYSGKSEYFGFFNEITFESGSQIQCERKAVVITAEECITCIPGEFSLNNLLMTYGDPAVKVKPNYQGVNDLYFYTNEAIVSFTNDFAKPLSIGSTTYYVAEICNGDTIQIVSAQILVQKANLSITAVNDTIEQNGNLPQSIVINYSGFKNGDTKNDLIQLPEFIQSTDGKVVGRFEYTKTQDAISNYYNLAYSIGGLLVTSTVGLDGTKSEQNQLHRTSNGNRLSIITPTRLTAYSVNGKWLWNKYFEIGTYTIPLEVYFMVDSKNSVLR